MTPNLSYKYVPLLIIGRKKEKHKGRICNYLSGWRNKRQNEWRGVLYAAYHIHTSISDKMVEVHIPIQ